MSLDAQGRLVTAGGDFVQGWTADAFGVVDSNNVVGQISVPIGTTAPPVATSTIDLAGNLPADAHRAALEREALLNCHREEGLHLEIFAE